MLWGFFIPWFSSLTLLTEVMGGCEMFVGHRIFFFKGSFEFKGGSIISIECMNIHIECLRLLKILRRVHSLRF